MFPRFFFVSVAVNEGSGYACQREETVAVVKSTVMSAKKRTPHFWRRFSGNRMLTKNNGAHSQGVTVQQVVSTAIESKSQGQGMK